MNIGMLWFDDSPNLMLTEKIDRAAKYYAAKYGCKPTLCYVHPGMLDGDPGTRTGEIEIKASKTIQRYHFWLGRQQVPTPG